MMAGIARDILFTDVFQRPERFFKLRLVIRTGSKERHDKRHKRTYKTYGSFDSTPYGVTLRMTLP